MTAQIENHTGNGRAQVIVATSVMLSFISFWRAAAIVLNDLGSSAYYVGGIAEKAVGRAAPWFILGVMLFSYAVRAVYVESCAMFTRGGVYRVVKEAMGGTLAKLSVSALMFDYVLTGPIRSDLGSSAYYVGGIAEKAVGRAAPWFILGVMLFSYAVRAVYVESCAMFTRGGVYRVVKEAMGGTLAKLSVSALMFDYVLTGPI